MKNFLSTTAILAALTAGSAVNAQGMTGDWYGSVFGGYSISSDFDVEASYGPYAAEVSQELDPGYILGVTIGTSVAPNLRAEAELSYAKYEAGDATGVFSYDGYAYGTYTYAGEGELAITYLMGNVWLDLPDMGGGSGAVPYVGGGVGGAKIELSDEDSPDDDTVLAYQIGAGIQFPAGAGMIDIGYRYKATGEPEFDLFVGEDDVEKFDAMSSNNLQIGYVMKF